MMVFPDMVSSVGALVQTLAVSGDYQVSESPVAGVWARDDAKIVADLTPSGPTGIRLTLKRAGNITGERTFAMHEQSVNTIARAIVEHLEGYTSRV